MTGAVSLASTFASTCHLIDHHRVGYSGCKWSRDSEALVFQVSPEFFGRDEVKLPETYRRPSTKVSGGGGQIISDFEIIFVVSWGLW